MPKPNNPATPFDLPPSKTIFIPRDSLAIVMAIGSPSEAQKEILRNAIVKKWPNAYELTRSDSVVSTLEQIKVIYRDKK